MFEDILHPDAITARVNAGAAWLDKHEPGWFDRIDLKLLCMADVCGCIGGQLRDTFGEFRMRHRMSQQRAIELGFLSAILFDPKFFPLAPGRHMDLEYDLLGHAWAHAITTRRAAFELDRYRSVNPILSPATLRPTPQAAIRYQLAESEVLAAADAFAAAQRRLAEADDDMRLALLAVAPSALRVGRTAYWLDAGEIHSREIIDAEPDEAPTERPVHLHSNGCRDACCRVAGEPEWPEPGVEDAEFGMAQQAVS